MVENSSAEFYEYVMSSGRSKSSASGGYGSTGRQGSGGGLDAATRLGLGTQHRRRTSIDYASDTEASTRSYGGTRRTYEGASGGWKPPPPLLGLGMTPTTPTLSFQPSSLQSDSRSNSLPRGGTSRFRREVHFEQSSTPSRPVPPPPSSLVQHHHLDSQEDSDGAVSAPELSEKQKQLQRLTQEHQRLLYGRSMGMPGSGPSSLPGMTGPPTGNFTSAEYKAWMQRAPSTSAIYERLRQSREAIEAHRAAKLTFSAENLVEKSKEVRLGHLGHHFDTASVCRAKTLKRLIDGSQRAHLFNVLYYNDLSRLFLFLGDALLRLPIPLYGRISIKGWGAERILAGKIPGHHVLLLRDCEIRKWGRASSSPERSFVIIVSGWDTSAHAWRWIISPHLILVRTAQRSPIQTAGHQSRGYVSMG